MTRAPVFIDTSAFYAIADAREDAHPLMTHRWNTLIQQKVPLVTSVGVVAETATLLRRWLGFDQAQAWLDQMERARLVSAIELIFAGEREYTLAREMFQQLGHPQLGFVDALSFAVMQLRGITHCLSLDDDFRQAGFELYE